MPFDKSKLNMDLYEPFEELVAIEVLGRPCEVPENQSMLRCFQFLSSETITYGKFCWNNDCGNCECQVILPGETEPATRRMCQTKVAAGVRVVGTSRHVKFRFK
ncbi:MAG: hypothetical protein FJX76_01985 [Armatimonadetes bacterium]|nr:hypothetical protein [Armatimonadota bacterium]